MQTSPFYGISYLYNDNLLLKFEKNPILVNGPRMPYEERESEFSIGLDYFFNDNFSLGLSFERGGFFSMKFVYKNDPKKSIKSYEYKKAEIQTNDSSITKLVKNLENNGIGVNKILENSRSLGLELTQFVHSDIALVEQIIKEASKVLALIRI